MKHLVGIFVAMLTLTAFAGDGFMGVTLTTINNSDEGSEDNGVYISKVMDGHGADEAGLQKNDQIIAINGQEVVTSGDLTRAMKDTEPGDEVSVTVLRDGDEMEALVTLGERPDVNIRKFAFEFNYERPFLGVDTDNLEKQLAAFFKVDHGVLITEVVEGSPAEKAGLKAGDVITAINDEPVHRVRDLFKLISDHEENQEITVAYVREGKARETGATLTKTKGMGMNNFNVAPFVVNMGDIEGLEALKTLENVDMSVLENLPDIMENMNFNFEFDGQDVLGKDFQEKLRKELDEAREKLKKLEKKDKDEKGSL